MLILVLGKKFKMKFRVWNKRERFSCYSDDDFFIDSYGDLFISDRDGLIPVSNDYILEFSSGIKDINGKEIYEGDIVKVTDNEDNQSFHLVEFASDVSYPAFDMAPSLHLESNSFSYAIFEDFKIEVVGNIHENPELLEKINQEQQHERKQ